MQEKISEKILEYYDNNKRNLPWRETKDPYSKWISEIMCQQTRVDTVIPYYERFMKKYPTIQALSEANEDELLKLWEGLGYYNRARNLKKAAIKIVQEYNGIFPNTYESLLKLPGIGDYTACAILSMAWDQPYSSIDGNFYRVFSRYYELDNDISDTETKEIFRKKIQSILPQRSGDFNQAIMDIGATICLANEDPMCEKCPLMDSCKAYKHESFLSYPVNSKKMIIKEVDVSVFIIEINEHIVLRKRPDKGLLASLYEFPNKLSKMDLEKVVHLFHTNNIVQGKEKVHHFTHQTWKLTPFYIHLDHYDLKKDEFFASSNELLNQYSIPKAFNQFIDKKILNI